MRRSWAVVVGIALGLAVAGGGCSFEGMATGDDQPAVDGGGGDDATPFDADGDGVPDEDDNCVDVDNPGQADEDHDLVGDDCDLCPTVNGATELDGDADEVGDSCDPNPTTPGDELLMFDGFNSTTLDAAWTLVDDGGGPSWTVNAGALIADVNDPGSVMLRPVGNPGDKLLVDVAAVVDEIGPSATRSFAVLSDASPTPLEFDFCAVSFDEQELELYRYENGSWNLIETTPYTATLGSYTVRTRTTAGPSCTVNGQALAANAVPGDDGHVGFRVRAAKVRFSYIAVYRSP